MKKIVIGYGLAMAALVALLQILEYRFFVRSLSLEVYMGLTAILFTVLGIWIGLKVTNRQPAFNQAESTSSQTPKPVFSKPQPEPQIIDQEVINQFGISNREQEVLILMARGLSNKEIADQLFVSLNTIKTHSSNLYSKLEVKRRTQAIQKAKDLKIII